MFRVGPDKLNRSVSLRVASKIAQKYGKDLFQYCHMGKEEAVYMHALNTCMTTFRPDFRLLLDGCPIYDTSKHLQTLGLAGGLPFLAKGGPNPACTGDCPPYFCHATWQTGGTSVGSEGVGVNIWGLLVMASLLGTSDLHPRGSSEFARKVLVQVLRHAPASATPGNMIPIRCFNVDTGKPQYLQIPDAYTRPEHFLRPVTDENFATSGELTYCRGKDGFLPDDMLHCANVVSTAMFLRCKVRDLTTDTLRGHYQLMPKRWYPLAQFSKPGESAGPMEVDGAAPESSPLRRGWIRVDDVGVHVRTWVQADATDAVTVTYGHTEWEAGLRAQGCLILPMVCRPCAAVWVGDASLPTRRIGVVLPVVPPMERTSRCVNFDHEGWEYRVMHEADTEAVAVSPADVLEQLIPIGTALRLKPYTASWETLKERLPTAAAQAGRPIRVRINVPPTAHPEDRHRLYVSYAVRTRDNVDSRASATLAVDPWELEPAQIGDEGDSPSDVVKELGGGPPKVLVIGPETDPSA